MVESQPNGRLLCHWTVRARSKSGYALINHEPEGNVLLRTEDAGRTWKPEILPGLITVVAASDNTAYAAGNTNGTGSNGTLFETADGGRSASPSSLSLDISGAHTVRASALRRSGGRVELHGRLGPALGGEKVVVSVHEGKGFGYTKDATVASDGAFSLTFYGITASAHFVAQWSGNGYDSGNGTPAVKLTVIPRSGFNGPYHGS